MSWRSVRVGDLVEAGALLISDGYRVTNRELGASGVPFVRGGDIRDGWIDTRVVDHVRAEFRDRIVAKLSQAEDVAFITKGDVGRVGFLWPHQPQVVFAPQVSYWRVLDREVLEPRFIYYLLKGGQFQASLDAVKTHGSMLADYVSLSDQRSFYLSLPPVQEQRSIAALLGALDDKINLIRRTNKTLDAIARAIFKSWFVDALCDLPPGWVIASLDSVSRFLNGLAMQKFPAREGEPSLPVIKIAELRRGYTTSSDRASLEVPPEYVVEDGSVLFSWSGSLEVVVWTGGRGALNQHVFKVSSGRYPKWFYYYWLKHHLPEFRSIAADKATTMGHIQRRHLAEALVAVPPGEALEEMDRTMSPLFEKQIANSLETRTLATLRDTLLPKLLSGEIRVKQAEKLVGEAV